MPAGRPPKTLEDLPPDWKEKILEYASQGMSECEIRANLSKRGGKFCIKLWYALEEREAEFRETLKIANGLCRAWWEEQARLNINHKNGMNFEAALWFMNMKNRFGWRDKTEIDHGVSDETYDKYSALSVPELLNKINELVGKPPVKKDTPNHTDP